MKFNFTFPTKDLCNHPQARDGMCGCQEGTDALDALFIAFLKTQRPDLRTPVEAILWTKDRLHWTPPFLVDLDGPTWNGRLSFTSQLPELNEVGVDEGLVQWSY